MSQDADIGRVLLGLQENLASIKKAVSSVQGPFLPQLAALHQHIERIERNLKSGADSCLTSLVTNSGQTAQELPYIKQKSSIRTPLAVAGEMRVRDVRSSYLKREVYVPKHKQNRRRTAEVPAVSEEELNSGLLALVNKGRVPRDVDLTPAFVRGAPPMATKPARIYHSDEKHVQTFTLIGTNKTHQIKYDFAPIVEVQGRHPSFQKRQKPAVLSISFDQNGSPKTEQQVSIDTREELDERGYNQLLDEFSSHFFIIRKGRALSETPEFDSFQRTFARKWASVSRLIRSIEFLMTKYEVPLITVDGKKLASLDVTNYTDLDLAGCIVNYGAIQHYITDPKLRFIGETGRQLAAVSIQSAWRMHKAHSAYVQLRQLINQAKVIQRAYRKYLLVKRRRHQTASAYKAKCRTWQQIQAKFQSDWPTLSKQKRIEVHLGSLSIAESRRLTMSKLLVRQNLELARVFKVQDPNVKVIYISSLEMTTEVLGYYYKVLEIGDIADPASKVTVITPQPLVLAPRHLSTTRTLLYCQASIKRLKDLLRRQKAYIVPHIMSKDEVELSVMLGIPVLGGDPSQASLCGTKSGSKRVFIEAEVPVPPAAMDIYDEREFYTTLTRLIAKNLHIDIWLFKIDDECGGRGIASLDLSTWKTFKNLKRAGDLTELQQEALHRALHSFVPSKVNIQMPSLYPNWFAFLSEFTKSGGIIEATPFCLPSKVQTTYVSMLLRKL